MALQCQTVRAILSALTQGNIGADRVVALAVSTVKPTTSPVLTFPKPSALEVAPGAGHPDAMKRLWSLGTFERMPEENQRSYRAGRSAVVRSAALALAYLAVA
jgi:hypothetical protein